jgi:PleD family two-component response regulator
MYSWDTIQDAIPWISGSPQKLEKIELYFPRPVLARERMSIFKKNELGSPFMKKILVVDDDDAIRMLIEMELKDEGYQVITASNAKDALKLVETEPLDLVILDIRMPGMDGLEALPRILGLKVS